MGDWVERLHQTGVHLRQHFCMVQNLVIRALVREKVNSRSSHPNVITHTNATNAGNNDDAILTRRKRQRDMGRYEVMKYYDKEVKIKKLTWSVIFEDAKSADEGRRLATSKIGPACGPCSLTTTSQGSLATAALDGDDNGAPPSSSSSKPPPMHAYISCHPPALPPAAIAHRADASASSTCTQLDTSKAHG